MAQLPRFYGCGARGKSLYYCSFHRRFQLISPVLLLLFCSVLAGPTTQPPVSCDYNGMIDRSSLYLVIGVSVTVILLLLLATVGIFIWMRKELSQLESQTEVLGREKETLRKQLVEVKTYFCSRLYDPVSHSSSRGDSAEPAGHILHT